MDKNDDKNYRIYNQLLNQSKSVHISYFYTFCGISDFYSLGMHHMEDSGNPCTAHSEPFFSLYMYEVYW